MAMLLRNEKNKRIILKSETFIKPKLAIVTPMPPERTGIARFSAELIPVLLELYDIKII